MEILNASHPEEICQDCKGPNVTWFTDNETWNRVMGGDGGILCPICFVKRAESKGIVEAWQFSIEDIAGKNSLIDELLRAACALVIAMETCHQCQAKLLVKEGPVYCQDGCSADCHDHIEPECIPITVLHGDLCAAISRYKEK